MLRYLLSKIPSLVGVTFVASLVAFFLPRATPGDPAVALAGPDPTPELVEAIRVDLGLDQPLVMQYMKWIGQVFQGDLGFSYALRRPVAEIVLQRLASTAELAVAATIVMVVAGVFLGLRGASTRSRVEKTAVDVTNTLLLALPAFVIGLFFILVFGIMWPILPASGEVTMATDFGEGLRYLILPALALGLAQAPSASRLLETSMLSIRRQDFVIFGIAKGVPRRRLYLRYILRNSLGPTVVVVGLRFAGLLAGAIVIELVFARNGLGTLAVSSVQARDYPTLQTIIVGAVLLSAVVQILTEVVQASLDPRVRLGD